MTDVNRLDALEPRRLFSFNTPAPVADLRVDSNRDGLISSLDNRFEGAWRSGKTGRGALILPNLDRDNTTTGAPDNWIGGNWNGRHVGVNNIIDNAADLRDIGRLRLGRLVNVDSSFIYIVTLKVVRQENDPAWLANVPAQDRVRVFMPSLELSRGRVVCQPGDAAVIGPGMGDTIRFVYEPTAENEFPLSTVSDEGFLEFGVEGVRTGAGVRFELSVSYKPVQVFDSGLGGELPEIEPEVLTDSVALRVAPFVLMNHTNPIDPDAGSVWVDQFDENSQIRKVMSDVFGEKLIISDSGDIWQQDGSEIGYARTPYGTMPIVLELPRARLAQIQTGKGTGMRAFIRGKLLSADVGVCTEVANYSYDSSSASGGDIESLPRPGHSGAPGFLVRSQAMPQFLKQFFDAQGVNPAIELSLDGWLGVGHVDEVMSLSPNGRSVFMADADLGYAMLLWAHRLDPKAYMLPGMAFSVEGFLEEKGVRIRDVLKNGRVRTLNVEGIMSPDKLPAAQAAIREAMGLRYEVSRPAAGEGNTGATVLKRAGVFSSLLPDQRRFFEVQFVDADRYQLRYRDGAGAWSSWEAGRRSQDTVFADAKVYLFPKYFAGSAAKAGDVFRFHSNPDATLIKMPVVFQNAYTFGDFGPDADLGRIEAEIRNSPAGALTTNVINSLSVSKTVVAGKSFGPQVNYTGAGASDLFQDYIHRAFTDNGYRTVKFVDARFYHLGGGGVHCGTNIFRTPPAAAWWEAT